MSSNVYLFIEIKKMYTFSLAPIPSHFSKLLVQIEILLGKTANFDELMAAAAAAAEERENGDVDEQGA